MRTCATILCLLLTVPAYAVDTLQVTTPDPMTEGWRWTEFDQSSGLGSGVFDIFEDRDRDIWFGTRRGVQHYDGHRWTTYTTEDGLVHNLVRDVYQTRDGAMWFGTRGGISRFDGETWSIYTMADSLASNRVRSLAQARDGTLWAGFASEAVGDTTGTQAGISRFDGTTWRTVDVPGGVPRPTVRDIHEASDGSLWFTTTLYGVLRFDGASWTRYTAEQGLAGNSVFRVLEARDGALWFTCFEDGISRFDGTRWQTYSAQDGLPEGVFARLLWQTDDGTIWTGTHATGALCSFDGDRWTTYSSRDIPKLSRVAIAKLARDGSIWFGGSVGARISRFNPSADRWTVYSDVPPADPRGGGAPDLVFAFGNQVWMAGMNRVVRYDGRIWQSYTVSDGLIDGGVTTIIQAKNGSIWVAGQHQGKSGAARFDGRAWQVFSDVDGLVGKNIYTGFVAENGDLWFGTKLGVGGGRSEAHGVMRYDGRNWVAYTTEDGLSHNMVYDIAQTPDGAMWFGTLGGLSRFDGTEWTNYTPGDTDNPLVHALCVAQDGSLWMGHDRAARGVTRYDGKTWTRYTSVDGLGEDTVRRIYQSRDGKLWFGINDGFSWFDGTNWGTYSEEIPVPFGGTITGFAETPDDALWLRGRYGSVMCFLPDRNAPETILEPAPGRVASEGNISVRWSGHDLWNDTPQQDLRFQWRLDEADWAPASGRMDFTFTALSSGQHRAEVRTIDRDGNVDTTPAVHAFIVEAPWWRNPVVAGPGLLIIAIALFQTVRVVQRDRRLQDSVDALSSANNELFQVNRDLESVNVDLQRGQVLERLRGQAQGMQSSEDIGPVVAGLFRELKDLGLQLIDARIRIRRGDMAEFWTASSDGRVPEPVVSAMGDRKIKGSIPYLIDRAMEQGDTYVHVHYEGEEATERVRQRIERGEWPDMPVDQWPEAFHHYVVFNPVRESGGAVNIASRIPVAEEDLAMVSRFREVFWYAHTRWEELKVKEAQNRRLVVEASVQRLRAEVQSMDEASDFERILSLLTDSLKTVELTFDGCEIDVLDEPVENPTMAHFESNGFRYTTYTLDPNGRVGSESFPVPAPFPGIVRQTIERFIESEPWQGTSEGEAIVEVPAGSYGRLQLNDTERDSFTDDEVATLREFADAVALGYARYLDIREIQLNTERKSEFLASMSHELRTPMNAIKGFTNLMLRRGKDQAWERNEENLQKVSHASDHLLTMINDLLDLSKIEAGRMDVNPERFDVKELVASACDTVSPLIQEGVELRQEVADDIGEANTDKARLQQMVINLLSNAIKFTDTGSVTVNASVVAEVLVIAVSDTGQGIAADELPTIFDEYRQAEGTESAVQKGTGLGLSITKKFAELLGGSIGVESEVGKGSTFTVRVPVEYQEPTS